MEKIKLNTIKTSDKNPRSITRDKLEALARSIKEFPEMMKLRPIVVNKEGVILGGNMRYRALKHLKYKEVPGEWVEVADGLTPEQEKRFVIEDNVAFGAWDMDILANEWDEGLLLEWGVDIPVYEAEKEPGITQDSTKFTKDEMIEFSMYCSKLDLNTINGLLIEWKEGQ